MQHEHPEYKHPAGGQAYYLRDPLFADIDERMQRLADSLVHDDGASGIKDTMADEMESLSADVYKLAPVEFSDLRASGHPVVTDDDEVIYDRAPAVPRLSEEELKAKEHLRNLGLGNRR